MDDRACFAGILFVLKTGIARKDLPIEMGCGCGMTCGRRLVAWHKAGVFERLHEELLARLRVGGLLDTDYALVDSVSLRVVLGSKKPGRTRPTGPKRAPSIPCSPMPTKESPVAWTGWPATDRHR